jgi:hypothetical protein
LAVSFYIDCYIRLNYMCHIIYVYATRFKSTKSVVKQTQT